MPQWGVPNNRCDLQNLMLDPQEGYGQTLLGYGRSNNKPREMTVKMTVNGFFEIQKFKFRKKKIFRFWPKTSDKMDNIMNLGH